MYKMDLVFATNNNHKIYEIKHILDQVENKFRILSLKDISCFDDIPEDGVTLEENAEQKSSYIYNKYNLNCFADDSGLEVEALNGAPGVYSARYAGKDKDFKSNIVKLLHEMNGIENRKARFRTVISLIINGQRYIFEGVINGVITKYERGSNGFGYDPIFQPDGYPITFAEMSLDEKNLISHRSKAIKELYIFLYKYF
ncbi:MAG: non-canonical purine NTP diphosphatase [Bacteroidota bacterium]|nr:non-canonical purine NTP diphosphatase [Bacteroidota bacterium]